MKKHKARIKKCIANCEMKILVTGSDGFIGKRLVQNLKLDVYTITSTSQKGLNMVYLVLTKEARKLHSSHV